MIGAEDEFARILTLGFPQRVLCAKEYLAALWHSLVEEAGLSEEETASFVNELLAFAISGEGEHERRLYLALTEGEMDEEEFASLFPAKQRGSRLEALLETLGKPLPETSKKQAVGLVYCFLASRSEISDQEAVLFCRLLS